MSPEEAETFIESNVCKKITKKPYFGLGRVLSYSREHEKWKVRYDDGVVDELNYTKLGKGKMYYNKWCEQSARINQS